MENFKRLWLYPIVQQKYSISGDLLQKQIYSYKYSKNVNMYNMALTFKLHLISGKCCTEVSAEHFQVFWQMLKIQNSCFVLDNLKPFIFQKSSHICYRHIVKKKSEQFPI